MEQEAANELVSAQGHRLFSIAILTIAVAQSDLVVFDTQDALVGEHHAMGVATEIIENGLERTERLFLLIKGTWGRIKILDVEKNGGTRLRFGSPSFVFDSRPETQSLLTTFRRRSARLAECGSGSWARECAACRPRPHCRRPEEAFSLCRYCRADRAPPILIARCRIVSARIPCAACAPCTRLP